MVPILNVKYIDLLMMFYIFALLGIIAFRFADYQKLNSEIVGYFVIGKDFVKINHETIDFKDVHFLSLEIRHYLNENQDSSINSFKPQYYIGKGNFFKIVTLKNKEYNGEFQILSRIDFLKLKNWQEAFHLL